MFTLLFYLILFLVLVDFILERILEHINIRHLDYPLPEGLKDISGTEQIAKVQAYQRENHRFGTWVSAFNLLLLLIMLFLSGFAFVNRLTGLVSQHPVVWGLLFFGTIMMAAGLLILPFSVYDTFHIEQKYGFNTTSPVTFITDRIKTLLLGAVIGGGLLALVITLYTVTGTRFWWMAWIVISAFSLFMTLFYSNLIVPLFNRQTPLQEGELREETEKLARNAGFIIDNIYVIDGSKRSTRANAYFTGWGPKKRIVLYDTLLKEMETGEIVAVLAHEIGHYRKKHVVTGLIAGILQTGVMLFLFSLFVKSRALSQALGVEEPSFHIGMVAFGMLYSPVSMATGIFMNLLSRKHEFEADRFAASSGYAGMLISALKKLAVKNLINLNPHPAYVFFNHSHPTLLQRIENISKTKTNES
jgi:STE24 endopeptidase